MTALRPSNNLAELLLQLFPAAFLAILFLQSGLDKVFDRAGNAEYMGDYFANSPLRGMVKPLLLAITVLEVASGVLNLLGFLQLVFAQVSVLAFWGAVLATAAFTCLFFGQRLAKDYAGAAGMVPYFLLGLAALYLQRR